MQRFQPRQPKRYSQKTPRPSLASKSHMLRNLLDSKTFTSSCHCSAFSLQVFKQDAKHSSVSSDKFPANRKEKVNEQELSRERVMLSGFVRYRQAA
jgi:hypothetical protein